MEKNRPEAFRFPGGAPGGFCPVAAFIIVVSCWRFFNKKERKEKEE